ncbi:glyoxalase [Fulvivirga sp. M361]|uniref:VOC family protein n=1 Tax=Fulvivirga sp. M361 TaxID=2594266 RepID=UPI00117AE305|nr:VOC family protein [Fulvivirga sp. M361]TRX59203.1 glyoxalase [Fulvivirga sp. M361]
MTKIDPTIAVKDVNASASWYQEVFDLKRTHGGDEFAVLVSQDGEIMICLHKWLAHEHPTMLNPNETPGNGLILYFRIDNIDIIRNNLSNISYPVEEEIHQNTNSTKKEFSLRDPDGYYLTITEYHSYKG